MTNTIKLLDNSKDYLISCLFPNGEVPADEIKEVQSFLISNGDIYAGVPTEIQILDYGLSFNILQENQDIPVRERFSRILDAHQQMKEKVSKQISYISFKMGGFLFRTPAGQGGPGYNLGQSQQLASTSMNMSCICGSGRRYEDCCYAVEGLKEECTKYPTGN